MKKVLSVLLAGIMAVGSSATVFAAVGDESAAASKQHLVAQKSKAANFIQNETDEALKLPNSISSVGFWDDDFWDDDFWDDDYDDEYDTITDIEVISGPANPLNFDDASTYNGWDVNPALLSGMKLKVTFETGETKILACGVDDDEIDSILEFEFEDGIREGSNPLTIRGDDVSITYDVEVTLDTDIESITVKKMPDKTEYAFYEDIDLSGLELEITYSNGTSTVYQYSGDNEYLPYYTEVFDGHYLRMYLDADTETHTYTINVYYTSAKTEFTLEVTRYVTDVQLIKLPDKVFTEEFDIDNIDEDIETEDDWNNFQKIREKTSISYNMSGAQLMFTFNEGDPIVYTFNEGDRIPWGESGLSSCTYITDIFGEDSINGFIHVTDLGNFKAEISYFSYENPESLQFTANYVLLEAPARTVLSDPETGISVMGDFEIGTELVVTTAKTALANAVAAYDITLVKDGEIIQLYDTITVSIPCKQSGLIVYHVTSDGTTENVKAEYEDGKYIFEVDHLSTFALVDDAKSDSTISEPKDDNKDTNRGSDNTDGSNAQTGATNTENSSIATGAGTAFTAILLMLILGMGMLILYMKRRENS